MRKQITVSTVLVFLMSLVLGGITAANDVIHIEHQVISGGANAHLRAIHHREAVEHFHIVKGSVHRQTGRVGAGSSKGRKETPKKVMIRRINPKLEEVILIKPCCPSSPKSKPTCSPNCQGPCCTKAKSVKPCRTFVPPCTGKACCPYTCCSKAKNLVPPCKGKLACSQPICAQKPKAPKPVVHVRKPQAPAKPKAPAAIRSPKLVAKPTPARLNSREIAHLKTDVNKAIKRIKDMVAVVKEAQKRGLNDVAKRIDVQIEGEEKKVRALRARIEKAAIALKPQSRRQAQPTKARQAADVKRVAQDKARAERTIKALKGQVDKLKKEVEQLKKKQAQEKSKPKPKSKSKPEPKARRSRSKRD